MKQERPRTGSTKRTVMVKRAYEKRAPRDGYRVLVDRLWPRGLRKDALPLNEWLRELAPSNELRRWFGHDPERWTQFRARYRRELSADPARRALDHLAERARQGPVTLVYAASDEQHNNAVVLKSLLEGRSRRQPATRRAPQRAPKTASKRLSRRTRRRGATRSG
jgi:uncharacterized protein YeaO (DUF488 family)